LSAGGGNDLLDGGTGVDRMAGGLGDDIYLVDSGYDVVTEAAASGSDVVRSSASYVLSANIERLELLAGALNGTGNASVNTLVGNGANNVLDGRAGADRMEGGAGNDTYIVDNVGDLLIELAGGGTDAVQSSVSYNLASNYYVENLTLTGAAAINATGNGFANVLAGNDAANILDGGASADLMNGRGGNDVYLVDNVRDRVIEAAGGGTDRIQSTVTFHLSNSYEVENLTLAGTAAINAYGNDLANTLIGNAGANLLNGGAGADLMNGQGGNDTYVVDTAGDRVFEASGGGTDTVQSYVSFRLSNTYEVENVTLLGSAAIDSWGNNLANTLVGNSAANLLNGGLGADLMRGLGGDDTYVVESSGDRVIESFGGGTDTVQSAITFQLSNSYEVENLTLTGSAAIDAFGNNLANILVGNSASNRLTGGLGADVMAGGGGADVFAYWSVEESTATKRDSIQLFDASDLIDLSRIDAVSGTAANDAFTFIGAAAFGHIAGELRAYHAGSGWLVEGDTNGDGAADLVIALTVTPGMAMTSADFLV
jgi:trimeric autotransporter adhesin